MDVQKILKLLEEKNHYLEKFCTLNKMEIENLESRNYENIDTFYQTREKILDLIQYLDKKIESDQCNGLSQTSISDIEKKSIRKTLQIKEKLAAQIVDSDLKILSLIEHAKTNLIQELQDIKKNRKAITGYKSPTFVQRVDEKY